MTSALLPRCREKSSGNPSGRRQSLCLRQSRSKTDEGACRRILTARPHFPKNSECASRPSLETSIEVSFMWNIAFFCPIAPENATQHNNEGRKKLARLIHRSAHVPIGRYHSATVNRRFLFFSRILLSLVICGCGEFDLQGANTLSGSSSTTNLRSESTISASPDNVNFGAVVVGQSAMKTVILTNQTPASLEIDKIAISSQAFSFSGQSSLPAKISSGESYNLTIKFDPSIAGTTNGQLVIETTPSSHPDTSIALSGNGTPGLSAFTCGQRSIVGAGTDPCSLKLNTSTTSGGMSVNLSSNNGAVKLPTTLTFSAGASSVSFNASVSPVSSAQSVALTASVTGSSAMFDLQLLPSVPTLGLSASSIFFGTTALNTPITQDLVLTASGGLPVSITSGTITGTYFKLSGASFPINLNSGETTTLNVEFDPTSPGSAAGQLLIDSSALADGSATVALSGTGVTYGVELNWNAPPASSSTITGYRVYRATGSGSNYQLLNSNTDAETTYTDTTVQNGNVYVYMVESVNSSGVQSSPSNTTTVTVP